MRALCHLRTRPDGRFTALERAPPRRASPLVRPPGRGRAPATSTACASGRGVWPARVRAPRPARHDVRLGASRAAAARRAAACRLGRGVVCARAGEAGAGRRIAVEAGMRRPCGASSTSGRGHAADGSPCDLRFSIDNRTVPGRDDTPWVALGPTGRGSQTRPVHGAGLIPTSAARRSSPPPRSRAVVAAAKTPSGAKGSLRPALRASPCGANGSRASCAQRNTDRRALLPLRRRELAAAWGLRSRPAAARACPTRAARPRVRVRRRPRPRQAPGGFLRLLPRRWRLGARGSGRSFGTASSSAQRAHFLVVAAARPTPPATTPLRDGECLTAQVRMGQVMASAQLSIYAAGERRRHAAVRPPRSPNSELGGAVRLTQYDEFTNRAPPPARRARRLPATPPARAG
jgi:hypothetical protein